MGSVLLITFEVFVLHIVPAPPVHFHRFNCFQMRRQRYELILEHPNFQRRKMIKILFQIYKFNILFLFKKGCDAVVFR